MPITFDDDLKLKWFKSSEKQLLKEIKKCKKQLGMTENEMVRTLIKNSLETSELNLLIVQGKIKELKEGLSLLIFL